MQCECVFVYVQDQSWCYNCKQSLSLQAMEHDIQALLYTHKHINMPPHPKSSQNSPKPPIKEHTWETTGNDKFYQCEFASQPCSLFHCARGLFVPSLYFISHSHIQMSLELLVMDTCGTGKSAFNISLPSHSTCLFWVCYPACFVQREGIRTPLSTQETSIWNMPAETTLAIQRAVLNDAAEVKVSSKTPTPIKTV